MAELAKNYHNNLQNRDPPPLDKDTRTVQIEAALEAIPNDQRLDDPGNSPMSRLITEDNIAKALKSAKKGTSTGMDGCPYELWKKLKQKYDTNIREGTE
jgi:hypothetical protein